MESHPPARENYMFLSYYTVETRHALLQKRTDYVYEYDNIIEMLDS